MRGADIGLQGRKVRERETGIIGGKDLEDHSEAPLLKSARAKA